MERKYVTAACYFSDERVPRRPASFDEALVKADDKRLNGWRGIGEQLSGRLGDLVPFDAVELMTMTRLDAPQLGVAANPVCVVYIINVKQ